MPQPGETRTATVKINSRLENHAGWPLLCTVVLLTVVLVTAGSEVGVNMVDVETAFGN